MFHGWGGFYGLTGTAAAGLIGLMFVVATLTSGVTRSRAIPGQRLFMTPSVFHLAAVLVFSSLAMAPAAGFQRWAIAAATAYGLCYAAIIAVQLLMAPAATVHWSDFWCYGAAPIGVYLLIAGALVIGEGQGGYDGALFAIGVLALLLVTVRNAWDLITWMAPRRDNPPEPPA